MRACRAVSYGADAQIARGYPDCTFRPSAAITRAEAVTMLVQAMGLEPLAAPSGIFHDLPAGSAFAPFMEAAAHALWTLGYPDERFGSDDHVSRAELSTLVVRASELPPTGTEASSFNDVQSNQIVLRRSAVTLSQRHHERICGRFVQAAREILSEPTLPRCSSTSGRERPFNQ